MEVVIKEIETIILTLKMCQTAELSNGALKICNIYTVRNKLQHPQMCYITIFGASAAPEQSSTNYTTVPVFQFKHAFIDTSFKIQYRYKPFPERRAIARLHLRTRLKSPRRAIHRTPKQTKTC